MHKKPEAFIFDADDTIFDFAGSIREHARNEYNLDVVGKPDKWKIWPWLGIEESESANFIEDFSVSWRFGCMEPQPGAARVLQSLHSQGIKLIILTACGTDKTTVELRKANLYNCFGNIFEEILFVDRNDTKFNVLKKLKKKYDILGFADDKFANIEDSLELKIPSFLYCQPHNERFREVDGVTDINDMYQLKHHLESKLNRNWGI